MNSTSATNQYVSDKVHQAGGGCKSIVLACPRCKTPLHQVDPDKLRCADPAGCPLAGMSFHRSEGIWRFLPPDRTPHYQQFVHDYEHIRSMEGRGSPDPAYYRALPFAVAGRSHHHTWQMRAQSYITFLAKILEPRECRAIQPLKIIDLGAGNGWLSNRLSQRGHCLAAVDLVVNSFDGLGAWIHYHQPFLTLQAEYECLPLAEAQLDLAIFNASLHYAERYESALAEALRVLQPGGTLVIMDSPFYRDPSSGKQMVRERASQFRQRFGTASEGLASENFLTPVRLAELAKSLDLQWQMVYSQFRLWDQLKRWISGLRAGREPARFPILWAAKPD